MKHFFRAFINIFAGPPLLNQQKLEKSIKELTALYQISKAISILDFHKTLQTIVKTTSIAFDCEIVSIVLLDENTNKLRIEASIGLEESVVRETHLEIGEKITGWVFEHNEPLLVENIENDERFMFKSNPRYYTKSLISAPLKIGNRILGVINVNNKRNKDVFTVEDKEFLETIASQSAIVIQNVRLFNKLQQEKEKILLIFDKMEEAAVITDSNLNVLIMNFSAEKIFNIMEEVALGRYFPKIVEDFKASTPWEEFLVSGKTNLNLSLTREKGKFFYLSVSANKIIDENGKVSTIVILFRDVTEEKHNLRVERNFLTSISHKLRTPLTVISGYVSLLTQKEDMNKNLHKSQMKALYAIEKESLILAEQVDKLLRFTLLENIPIMLDLQKGSISHVIDNAIRGLAAIIEFSKTSVEISPSLRGLPEISMDKIKIQEAVSNIIENAIKFNSKENKNIWINGVISDNKSIQVEIKDNGPGIPPEEQEKIFHDFYQIDEYYTGGIEGVGLGLSVTKKLIEKHSGKIWVESKIDEGSKFCFTLPLETPQ